MINRLNVIYLHKRTTARFPDYLFSLAMDSSRSNQEDVSRALKRVLEGSLHKDHHGVSASVVSKNFLIFLITHGLGVPIGHRDSLSRLTDSFMGISRL